MIRKIIWSLIPLSETNQSSKGCVLVAAVAIISCVLIQMKQAESLLTIPLSHDRVMKTKKHFCFGVEFLATTQTDLVCVWKILRKEKASFYEFAESKM